MSAEATSVPESHRRLLAKLEGPGLHMHKDYVLEVWRTVGLVQRTHGAPLRVCGTDRCFLLKLRNVRAESGTGRDP